MKSPRRRSNKPARRSLKKKGYAKGKMSMGTGRRRDAVAIAVGRALTRAPRVNPALVEALKANRDLLV
jgi:hypothetical protein